MDSALSWFRRLRVLVIGSPKDLDDPELFRNLSLIAFLGWVGLGADGLSSSCYGPEEMFLALGGHTYLAIFIALASAATVFVISASYSQIIELFPTGGGSYLVASKLLSPALGMVAGCSLLVDYVLTITISIASGSDALFSILPPEWQGWRVWAAAIGVLLLLIMNLRGVKESVVPLVPIFIAFVFSHIFVIVYALMSHAQNFPALVVSTGADLSRTRSEVGLLGLLLLLMHAYSMGAGTFTGIEAVSNGLPMLREPRVATGKRTMKYMAWSLAFTAAGLILAYLLYDVAPVAGKTLNAVLLERVAQGWPAGIQKGFVYFTLASEAALLFIAAQAGFLDGPRILANMALDRWVPTSFATLSDRFVSRNSVLLMGSAALGMLVLTGGSVKLLVVLYSINVFITFVLSQAGMVRHWWQVRAADEAWLKKLSINGLGLAMCAFILISVVLVKFREGGWVTLAVTGGLILMVMTIRAHYDSTGRMLSRLDRLVDVSSMPEADSGERAPGAAPEFDRKAKTAVVLVSGFNGLGLHTLFNIPRVFGDTFRNFVFVQIALVDAGNFKGAGEVDKLEEKTRRELGLYVALMRRKGYYADCRYAVSNDLVDQIAVMAPGIAKSYPNAVFFGGQIVFPQDTLLSRWLHSFNVFALQKRLYYEGFPMVLLPVRV
ncbi:MAG: amino acid transporter [Elusimicrobia bacterium RIFCSPLOWO2_12_FULL_59_9]|nr:MAG: amino acid transporter [Elusimicrobia bacterium RIFCSPLOWO2_12_FULL_59_9]